MRDFHEKHHAVNVTACEFLELMLKSSKDRGCASTVAHMIIDHLQRALYTAISKKDNAMQVQLLNLLNVVLFECQFSRDMENCKKVLTSVVFIDILTQGLKNQVAYVRQHFIDFVVYLIPMMTNLLHENDIIDCVKEIISCLTQTLRRVDIRIYGEKINDDYAFQTENARVHHYLRQGKKLAESELHITSELEIKQLFDGLKLIIYHCLGI